MDDGEDGELQRQGDELCKDSRVKGIHAGIALAQSPELRPSRLEGRGSGCGGADVLPMRSAMQRPDVCKGAQWWTKHDERWAISVMISCTNRVRATMRSRRNEAKQTRDGRSEFEKAKACS